MNLILQINSDYKITLSDNSIKFNIFFNIQILKVPFQKSFKVLKSLKENFKKILKEISSILIIINNTFKKSIIKSIKQINEILNNLLYKVLKNNSFISIPYKKRFSISHSSNSFKISNRIAFITGSIFYLIYIHRQNDKLFISFFHKINKLIDQHFEKKRLIKLVDITL